MVDGKLFAKSTGIGTALFATAMLGGCFEIGQRDLDALYTSNGVGCPLQVGRTYAVLGLDESGRYPEQARFTVLDPGQSGGCVVREVWAISPAQSDGLRSMVRNRFARLGNGDLIAWRVGQSTPTARLNPDNPGVHVAFLRRSRDGSLAEKSQCGADNARIRADFGRLAQLTRYNFSIYHDQATCRLNSLSVVSGILDDPIFATTTIYRPVN